MKSIPSDFTWGVASSAFQIEGATGRGRSVWDDFCDQPGRIQDGSSGEIACDHLNRLEEDLDLIAGMGVDAYRFSVAWTRIFPTQDGVINMEGVDFYNRVVDGLLKRGISPWVCIHHWDMPDYIEAKGGWRNRDSAEWFADFCGAAMEAIGDRIDFASPFNEPNVVPWVAYDAGDHAPGRQTRQDTLAAIHHINLAQGKAFQAMRVAAPEVSYGTIYSLAPVHPARNDAEHFLAAAAGDVMWRRVMLDPIMLGKYPDLLAQDLEPFIKSRDWADIQQPIDFFGLNHYSRLYIQPDGCRHFGAKEASPPAGSEVTAWGWEVDPTALNEQLFDLKQRYPDFNGPIYITENGAAYDDHVLPNGDIQDDDRISFFKRYIAALDKALEDGFDIRGYFFWSIMDNFEWNAGFTKRFGLSHIDYETLERTPKASYHFARELIAKVKSVEKQLA